MQKKKTFFRLVQYLSKQTSPHRSSVADNPRTELGNHTYRADGNNFLQTTNFLSQLEMGILIGVFDSKNESTVTFRVCLHAMIADSLQALPTLQARGMKGFTVSQETEEA